LRPTELRTVRTPLVCVPAVVEGLDPVAATLSEVGVGRLAAGLVEEWHADSVNARIGMRTRRMRSRYRTGLCRASLEESIRVDIGSKLLKVSANSYLSRCYAAVGDAFGTQSSVRRGVTYARDTGARALIALILDYSAQAFITLGLAHEGAVIAAAVAGGRIAPRALSGKELSLRQEAQQVARNQLGEVPYATAIALGNAMTPEQAITYTLDIADRLSAQTKPRPRSTSPTHSSGNAP